MKRAWFAAIAAASLGCGSAGTTTCEAPIELRAYEPSLAVGPFGPGLPDLETFDTFVAGAGDVVDEDTTLSAVLVGLADGWGCELPELLDVAVWAQADAEPAGAPGARARGYATATAHARRVGAGLVELELALDERVVVHAGERVFVALRLADPLTCAVAALPAAEPTRAWRWRPSGWASLSEDYVDLGVGVVGVVACAR